MPGSRNSVGGGVQDTDDKSEAFLPGEAAGLGTVNVVRGGDANQVAGNPYVYAAWEGSRW